MEPENELQSLTNELFRRVGRNLVNYQQLERMLKQLVAHGRIAGPAKELKDLQQALADSLHKLTMGQVAGRFTDDILSDAGDIDDGPEIISEPWITIGVRLDPDDPFNSNLQEGLRTVVEERNHLVHHMLGQWDRNSVDSTNALMEQLDAQRERMIPVYQEIAHLTKVFLEARKATVDFWGSEAGQLAFKLAWLQQSPIVKVLSECSKQLGRAGGWLPLATAGQIIRQQEPEDSQLLKQRYGYSTLKQVVIASQMFDIYDEPTAKGFRTVYRLKTDETAHAKEL